MIYSKYTCINNWKNSIINDKNRSKGRGQPYLKEIVDSNKCNVTILPNFIQLYFNNIFYSSNIMKYSFIHFTGKSKNVIKYIL